MIQRHSDPGYGERPDKLIPLDEVALGRMEQPGRMNEHHLYDEVPHEAKGRRMEKARWIEVFKPTADDLDNVSCRLVVQQYKDFVRDDTHHGTPPLRTLRFLHSLAVSELPRGNRQIALWDAVVAFFHSPFLGDDRIYVARWVLRRALHGTGRARYCVADCTMKSLSGLDLRQRCGFRTCSDTIHETSPWQ